MKIIVDGKKYEKIEVLNISVSDFWVDKKLKLKKTTGSGSKQLYIGKADEKETFDDFFEIKDTSFIEKQGGEKRNINMKAFALYEDLIEYLDDAVEEFKKPSLKYKFDLKRYYSEILGKINEKSIDTNKEEINLDYRACDDRNRYFITQKDRIGRDQKIYQYMTQALLPAVSFISIVKIKDLITKEFSLYFKPSLNYEYTPIYHKSVIKKEENRIKEYIKEKKITKEKSEIIFNARIGQGEYKNALLKDIPVCIFTEVSDERLLDACHIKPWVRASDEEKIDSKNGLTLTPTYHRLLDRGFITFDNKGNLLVSPYITNFNIGRLSLIGGKKL